MILKIKFILINLLLLIIISSTSYGQKNSIDVLVDNTKINISVPSGFKSVDSSTGIWKIAESITNGKTKLLAVIVKKDISTSSRTDITPNKYLLVQVSKQIRDQIHSDNDFSEVKNVYKNDFNKNKVGPSKLKKKSINN